MKPGEGLPHHIHPESVQIILLKGEERYNGLADATLCPECIQPLKDYLIGIGILKA